MHAESFEDSCGQFSHTNCHVYSPNGWGSYALNPGWLQPFVLFQFLFFITPFCPLTAIELYRTWCTGDACVQRFQNWPHATDWNFVETCLLPSGLVCWQESGCLPGNHKVPPVGGWWLCFYGRDEDREAGGGDGGPSRTGCGENKMAHVWGCPETCIEISRIH